MGDKIPAQRSRARSPARCASLIKQFLLGFDHISTIVDETKRKESSRLRIVAKKLLGKCATSRPLSFQRSNRFVDHGFRLTFLERDR
jgi:hypothetical protein